MNRNEVGSDYKSVKFKEKNNDSFTHNNSFNKPNLTTYSNNSNPKSIYPKHKSTSANDMIAYLNHRERERELQQNNEEDYSNFNIKNNYYTPDDYKNKFKDFYSLNTNEIYVESNKGSTNVSGLSLMSKGNINKILIKFCIFKLEFNFNRQIRKFKL